MDITRLRKCTEKSTADFHFNSKWTVEMLLNDNPFQVLKYYYTLEKIDFTDSIKERLKEKYHSFFEIPKPGKFKDWKKIIFEDRLLFEDMNRMELNKLLAYYRIQKKEPPYSLRQAFIAAKCNEKVTKDNCNLTLSKQSLQAINHGKLKR